MLNACVCRWKCGEFQNQTNHKKHQNTSHLLGDTVACCLILTGQETDWGPSGIPHGI